MTAISEKIVIEDELFEEGWMDGLPVVLPTEQRVEDMLCATNRKRDETIGYVAPLMGAATVEKAAINSVMAGCKPEYYRMLPEGITMPLRARSLLLGSAVVEDPIRMLFSLPRPHPIPIHSKTPGD